MKTKNIKLFSLCLFSLFLIFTTSTNASDWTTKKNKQIVIDTLKYNVYKGKIIDSKTRKKLMFATITVDSTNLATVSNSDGEFVLKIPKHLNLQTINISYIAYQSLKIKISELKNNKNTIKLSPVNIPLAEIDVYPHDPIVIVKQMIRNIKTNYSSDPNMMRAFYRETVKKNKTYVGITEAIVNIRKAGYSKLSRDQVQIYKSRSSKNVKKMDTLLFKLQGGPSTSLMLDVIKNQESLFSEDFILNYDYTLSNITKINNKLHYIIEFKQKKEIDYPLYYGKLYIDSNNLALTSAHFSLNLDNKSEASLLFIRKKPLGVKVTPSKVNYIVNYRQQGDTWYFNYARGEITFKCKWKKKLFNTNYSAMTEMAITDRYDKDLKKFKRGDKFSSRDVLSDQVSNFSDTNFWGEYNTIEPDQSIGSAIKKLKRKGNL